MKKKRRRIVKDPRDFEPSAAMQHNYTLLVARMKANHEVREERRGLRELEILAGRRKEFDADGNRLPPPRKPTPVRIALGLDPDRKALETEVRMRRALGIIVDPNSKTAKRERRERIALGLPPDPPPETDDE
jgi:hypothetical protein